MTYKVTDEDGVPIEGAHVETIVETKESLSRWYGGRIVRNERGEIVSEHFGKIYGPTRTVGFLKFEELFFNPTPNDTNIEEKR